MPHKWLAEKGIEIKKQCYNVTNWSDYNNSLRNRGDIEVWLSWDVEQNWYHETRHYDGTGSTKLYTDDAIKICHELRQVFKQPLRQTQGFINSLFRMKSISLCCPDYSTLSNRLCELGETIPRYTQRDKRNENIAAIAIDSTGLKRFG